MVCRLLAPAVLPALGVAGCDSDQYVLFKLQDLPIFGTTTVRTTYTLDSSPGKKGIARVTAPVDQFAIVFPGGTRGTLSANVRAYTYVKNTECYRSDAGTTILLDGSHKQDLLTSMPAPMLTGCDATQVPVKLPPTEAAPLATWATAPNNLWVVGDKGVILHWDGAEFATVPLPPELAAAPPTWRTVSGVGSNQVYVAGDRGAVVKWNGSQLVTVGLQGATELPNWVSLAVGDAAADDVYFVSKNGYIGRKQQGSTMVQIVPRQQVYPVYPIVAMPTTATMSATVEFSDIKCFPDMTGFECWVVGYDAQSFASSGQLGGGAIFQIYTSGSYTLYSDYSMSNLMTSTPLTRSRLRGISALVSGQTGSKLRQLHAVGDGATALLSNNSLYELTLAERSNTNYFPRFQTDYSPILAGALQGRSQRLNAIAGTQLADLWIAGDGGLLIKWENTPVPPGNPFTLVTTNVTANLTSVVSTGLDTAGRRVYAAGEQQTFISP